MIRFRPDIEGLRAVAVLLVILNHLDVPGFHGGFVGVDVFFVISGYLITSLLVAEYANKAAKRHGLGSISITHFYVRRARRILPAAVMVIACVLVASNLLLNALRFEQVKQDAVWTALFASNINFIRQATDYFAADFLATSPYQHYWSLAVEEQYYLVWPVLFLLVTTLLHGITVLGRPVRWRARLGATLATVGVVSFAWSIHATTENPASAYFSAFTRAWELALGGLLALVVIHAHMTPRRAGATSLAGLALLIAGCVVIDSESAFPGYLAVLPTLGAALVIAGGFGKKMPVTNLLLGTAPMRFIGRISYSLYLWHWPLIVFAAALYPTAMTRIDTRVGIFALTFVVSVASYYFIERPFRSVSVNVESERLRRLFGRHRSSSNLPLGRERAIAAGALVCAVGLGAVVATGAQLPSDRPTVTSTTRTESTASLSPVVPASSSSTRQRASDGQTGAGGKPGTQPKEGGGERDRTAYARLLQRWQVRIRKSLGLRKLPSNLQPLGSHLDAVDAPCQNYRLDIVDHTEACTWGNPNATHVAAITGDSHASMWLATIQAALDPDEWALRPFTRSWCGWTDGQLNEGENKDCPALQRQTLSELRRLRPDVLILSQDGFMSYSHMATALRRFTQVAKRVVVLGRTPYGQNFTSCLRGSTDISNCHTIVGSDHFEGVDVQRTVAEDFRATFVDTTTWFCFEGYRCPPVIDGAPVFIDGNHLSAELAPKLAPLLRAVLRVG